MDRRRAASVFRVGAPLRAARALPHRKLRRRGDRGRQGARRVLRPSSRRAPLGRPRRVGDGRSWRIARRARRADAWLFRVRRGAAHSVDPEGARPDAGSRSTAGAHRRHHADRRGGGWCFRSGREWTCTGRGWRLDRRHRRRQCRAGGRRRIIEPCGIQRNVPPARSIRLEPAQVDPHGTIQVHRGARAGALRPGGRSGRSDQHRVVERRRGGPSAACAQRDQAAAGGFGAACRRRSAARRAVAVARLRWFFAGDGGCRRPEPPRSQDQDCGLQPDDEGARVVGERRHRRGARLR